MFLSTNLNSGKQSRYYLGSIDFHTMLKKREISGTLKTDEINKLIEMLIKREQIIFERTEPIQNDMKQLNLDQNYKEVYRYQGRIQGDCPIYIPRNSKLAEQILQHFQKRTYHGGVILILTALKDQYWILKLRQLKKRIIRNCYGCKRHSIRPYDTPPPSQLTRD